MKKILISFIFVGVLGTLTFTVLVMGDIIRCSPEHVEKTHTCDVKLLEKSANEVTFRVWSTWSNTSGEFSHFEVEADGFNYNIQIFGKCTKPCMGGEAETPFYGDLTIEVSEPGSYHFSFCNEHSYIGSAQDFPNICSWDILMGEE